MYGRLIESVDNGKFTVRWADGTVTVASRGQLRTEKAPTIPIIGGAAPPRAPSPAVVGVTGPSATRPSGQVSESCPVPSVTVR